MTDVLIKRELLEDLRDCANECYNHARFRGTSGLDNYERLTEQADAILAAPRQPDGEGLEVVAYQSIDATRGGGWMAHKHALPQAHIDQGALQEPLCRLSDAQRAIAELREEREHLKACQENAMLHMTGLVAERNTLRQQLAEARDEICQHSNDLTIAYMAGAADMKKQRDKLAGLLDEVTDDFVVNYLDADLIKRIDAALAEANK